MDEHDIQVRRTVTATWAKFMGTGTSPDRGVPIDDRDRARAARERRQRDLGPLEGLLTQALGLCDESNDAQAIARSHVRQAKRAIGGGAC